MLTTVLWLVGGLIVYLLVAVASERWSPLVGIGVFLLLLSVFQAL